MDDWLLELGSGRRVLDLACASGSFPVSGLACSVIAIDEDPLALHAAPKLPDGPYWRVAGRIERLPVASGSIDLAICNHGFEHFTALDEALQEIKRVLKPDGRLYVSVPDGFGFCDGLYRWVFDGGGHVNRFRRDELVRRIESQTGLRLGAWQKLYSSFGYLLTLPGLHARGGADLPRRVRRIGRLPRAAIGAAQVAIYAGTRVVDRVLGSGSALYGWAFWFDHGSGAAEENPGYVNVCRHCGAGHPPDHKGRLGWKRWLCTSCGRRNPFWFG